MHRTSGLQIDPRCVKCDRENSAEVALYELRNHAYICGRCYSAEMQRGKTPLLVSGTSPMQARPTPSINRGATGNPPQDMASPPRPPASPRRQTASLRLPPDSMYALLGLSLAATASEIGKEIEQKMRSWLRAADSQEKSTWLDRLQEWQDVIDDPGRFEEYREKIRQAVMAQQGDRALSVGGRLVSNAEEFLEACEASSEGWADGQRYLRNGRLKEWVRYQVNRTLADNIARYQTSEKSDFCSLNEALYCLVPQRGFRLYNSMQWQSPTTVPSAATPEELAQLCDKHWALGELHLYEGSMVYWLEQCRGRQGLQDYYEKAVVGYERDSIDRGVGLELLLERAVPRLPKPQLVVTFNGTPNAYSLERWDRELAHAPVTMKIVNTTRGFVCLSCEFAEPPPLEAPWIDFDTAPPAPTPFSSMNWRQASIILSMRPGEQESHILSRSIMLANLSSLKRGRTYSRKITMKMRGESGQWHTINTFPVTLKTMNGFQGMYGKLWLWGMRGGLPALVWSFLVGTLLAYIPFILQYMVSTQVLFTNQLYTLPHDAGQALQLIVLWSLFILRWKDSFPWQYPLLVGAITGIVGFCISYGQGHMVVSEQQNRSRFRKWSLWLSLLAAFTFMFILNNSFGVLGGFFAGRYYTWEFLGGLSVVFLLTLLLTYLVAYIRFRYERHLRTKYDTLLHPPERA